MEERKAIRYYDMHIHFGYLALSAMHTYLPMNSLGPGCRPPGQQSSKYGRAPAFLRVGFETLETTDGGSWKVVGDLPNEVFGHTKLGLWASQKQAQRSTSHARNSL